MRPAFFLFIFGSVQFFVMPGNTGKVGNARYRRIEKKSHPGATPLGIDMALFNGNDHASFISLYNQLFPFIFYFAKRFVGSEDAEDITADAFCTLWKMEKKFRNVRSIKIFLQVTARNACINHLQHAKVINKAEQELLNTTAPGIEAFDFSSELTAEKIQLIFTEIEKMPLQRKKIFKLSYISGLKDKEIAARLHLSLSSVYNHKSVALKQLRLSSIHLLSFFSVVFTLLFSN
jgi:RNA polymerase sigma-19 factor, ECF subfamily